MLPFGLICSVLASINSPPPAPPNFRLMASIPPGTIASLPPALALDVFEDLGATAAAAAAPSQTLKHPPIIYVDHATGAIKYSIPKTAERLVPANASSLWGRFTSQQVFKADGDLLAASVLSGKNDPAYAEVAA